MGAGRHGEGFKYYSVANGQLNTSVNGQRESYDYYHGYLKAIHLIEDEFEGQPVAKVQLVMEDDKNPGEMVKIKFTQEAWFSVGFFSRIKAIDLARPFTLGVMQSEQNEKVSFAWMRQDGKKIVADKENTPRPEKRKMGKRTVMDWQGFNEFVESTVAEINGRLALEVPADGPPPHSDEQYEPDEDLPF